MGSGFASLWLTLAFTLGALTTGSGPQTSSSSRHSKAENQPSAAPDLGFVAKGIYRNAFFGFSFHLPFGWVERTAQMREIPATPASSALLLSVWERPPEVPGSQVNPAVIIAAEKMSTYPGLKAPEQYFGPLTEVATRSGLQVVSPPYEFRLANQQLVRADFSKVKGDAIFLQSTLVLLRKGYVLSFTFIAESGDEVAELIDRLSFARALPGASQPSG